MVQALSKGRTRRGLIERGAKIIHVIFLTCPNPLSMCIMSEVVVLLVLLTWWQDFQKPAQPYDVLEFYAGVGRIARVSKFIGLKSAAVDIEYGKASASKRGSRPPMDINSDAGLLWPGK